MSAMLDYMQLCRLCLVKEKVNVPIFGDDNDVRQIFLKITACLPVKVTQEDNLPKKICDACLYKVDLLYQFWNTTVNAEKQLIQWLTEIGVDVNIKNSDSQTLPILPQSHAHPHSIPAPVQIVTVPELKQERPDIVEKPPEFQIPEQPNLYSGYDNLGYPQAEVTMEVGATNNFVQPEPAEEPPPPEPPAPTPKKRGRPAGTTNKKTAAKKKPTPAPPVVVSPRTNSTRRSSATAAAAAVAAAAAAATDSEEDSDADDRLGGMDYNDSDSDEDHVTKEEIDSDEDYEVKPKSFLGVPSSADGEQPGPSGLGGVKTEASGANATESGRTYSSNEATKSDPSYVVVGYVPLDSLSQMGLLSSGESAPPYLILKEDTKLPSTVSNTNTSVKMSISKLSSKAAEKYPCKRKKSKSEKSKTQERKWPCSVCGKFYLTKWAAQNHVKLVHERNFNHECTVCGKKFRSQSEIEIHTRRHFSDYVFPCKECNKGYQSKYLYDEHYKVAHEGFRYICFPCDKSIKDRSYFYQHMNTHNPDYVPKELKCKICGDTFTHRGKYVVHMHKHRHVSGFVCDICGKKLTSKGSLLDHRKIHTGETPFTCQTCGKGFKCFKYLHVHMRVHTNDKPYTCEVCGKVFSQQSSLGVHRRLHTGERPYTCTFCEKSCITRYSLKMHMKVHGIALANIKSDLVYSSDAKPESKRDPSFIEVAKNKI